MELAPLFSVIKASNFLKSFFLHSSITTVILNQKEKQSEVHERKRYCKVQKPTSWGQMNYRAVGTTGELKLLPLRPHQPHVTFTHSLPPQTPSTLMSGSLSSPTQKHTNPPKRQKGCVGKSHICFHVRDCEYLSRILSSLKGRWGMMYLLYIIYGKWLFGHA